MCVQIQYIHSLALSVHLNDPSARHQEGRTRDVLYPILYVLMYMCPASTYSVHSQQNEQTDQSAVSVCAQDDVTTDCLLPLLLLTLT